MMKRIAVSIMAVAMAFLLSGCFGAKYPYQSVWQKVYGKKPPYTQDLNQVFVEEAK